MQGIHVLIVDGRPLLRQVLARHLARTADHCVVNAEGDRIGAERVLLRLHVDVVVLAIDRPEPPRLGVIRALKRMQPLTKVLVLAERADLSFVAHALGAGADGILTGDDDLGEMSRAIRHVADGGRYICPAIAHEFAMRGIRSNSGRLPPAEQYAH